MEANAHGDPERQQPTTSGWSPACSTTGTARNGRIDRIVARGYDKGEINLAMTDETRKALFPDDGLVTDLGTKAAEEGVDLGNPKGGTLATIGTALSAIGAAGAVLLLPGLGLVVAGPRRRGPCGRGGGGHRRRSDRRAASLGHSRIANGRISSRDQARAAFSWA